MGESYICKELARYTFVIMAEQEAQPEEVEQDGGAPMGNEELRDYRMQLQAQAQGGADEPAADEPAAEEAEAHYQHQRPREGPPDHRPQVDGAELR